MEASGFEPVGVIVDSTDRLVQSCAVSELKSTMQRVMVTRLKTVNKPTKHFLKSAMLSAEQHDMLETDFGDLGAENNWLTVDNIFLVSQISYCKKI